MTDPRPDSQLLRFTKHHGAGNDFLVQVDPGGSGPLPADLVRALCDRRFGVGADGVSGSRTAAARRTWRWCCRTPTAARPR